MEKEEELKGLQFDVQERVIIQCVFHKKQLSIQKTLQTVALAYCIEGDGVNYFIYLLCVANFVHILIHGKR